MSRKFHGRRQRDPLPGLLVVSKRLRLAAHEMVRSVTHQPRLLLPELLVNRAELRGVDYGFPSLADFLAGLEGCQWEASQDVLQHVVAQQPP